VGHDPLASSPGWQIEPGRGDDVRLLHGSSPEPGASRALQEAVIAAFPEYRLAVYFTVKGDVFGAADHVVVARQEGDGSVLGILTASERSCRVGRFLHVEMNLITSTYQRRGLLLPLWRIMLTRLVQGPDGFPELFAIKTYNPMVYSSFEVVARLSGASLYPTLPATTGHPDEQPLATDVATEVAATLSPETPFDPATGVLHGAGVPRDFYAALPATNKREVYDYFADHLEPGDRLLILLRFGAGSDHERLLRRLGVGSISSTT
jgi:hypothetical protein